MTARMICRSLLGLAFAAMLGAIAPRAHAAPLGTAFTYQGQLQQSGSPANATCDFQFSLFDAVSGGTQLDSTQTASPVSVSNGLFTVELNDSGQFGASAFDGSDRWLQIAVRCPVGSGSYATLSPRQPLTATPYALYAPVAGSANAVNCTGCVSSANLAAGAVTDQKVASGIAYSKLTGAPTSLPPSGPAGGSLSGTYPNPSLAANAVGTAQLQDGAVTSAKLAGGGGLSTVAHNATLSGDGTSGVPLSVTVPLSLSGSSSSPLVSATNTGNGNGVVGSSNGGYGVVGDGGNGGYGVFATASGTDSYGVYATGSSRGVYGSSSNGTGVQGQSDSSTAVYGGSTSSNGVWGFSGSGTGVYGLANATTGTAPGVVGVTNSSDPAGIGVYGQSGVGRGVQGNSASGTGVYGYSGSGLAADFVGTTRTKVLQITGGSDLSEQFDVKGAPEPSNEETEEQVQPGMVVSIDPTHPGKLLISHQAYDHRVAGIISGAGGVKPGMLMGQSGSLADGSHPLALAGRVYCWADASSGPIEPGDLLTTSHTSGHAMKVTDHAQAQGAIIGKAMTGLKEGKGLVLALVTLQ